MVKNMNKLTIDNELLSLANEAEIALSKQFKTIDEVCEYNSNRVLSYFIENSVSYSDFQDINGYGNYDSGRDKLEKIFASILGTEDSLVRPQIMSGTNALYIAFTSILRHGDTLLSITGKPYDSLLEMIGMCGESSQSLKANGVNYEQIDLLNDDFDFERIKNTLTNKKIKLIEIQKSRGYSNRHTLSNEKIKKVISFIKSIDKDVIVLVDNCYGELTEKTEPGHAGADIVVGSLMKNLGGGIASTGGYIAGTTDVIKMVADRLTAPGIGKEQGANFNQNIQFFKGVFLAPQAVKNALKTMIFASFMLEKLGYDEVSPKYTDPRYDIIQTVTLNSKENLINFAQGIQSSSPVDSFVHVMAAPMPGYPFDEVMAAGCFSQGSTIELSADAPVISPYVLYMQGGLTYEYGKLGIMSALTKIKKKA